MTYISNIKNIFFKIGFIFCFVLFILLGFSPFIEKLHAEEVSNSVNITASVYSCDFIFSLSISNLSNKVNLANTTELKFTPLSTKEKIINLKLDIDKDGFSQVNLCDQNIFSQGGMYDIELNSFGTGYKEVRNASLFRTYQSKLSIAITPEEISSGRVCSGNLFNNKVIQSLNEGSILSLNKSINSYINEQNIGKNGVVLSSILLIHPFVFNARRKNKSIDNKTKGLFNTNLIEKGIKTYIESLKFCLCLIQNLFI